MKIYIVGTGGVGGYFGGRLARAGHDVTFVARDQHRAAIETKGLRVKSIAGDFSVMPANVIGQVAEIADPDLVLFAVKTYDTDKASEALAPVVHKDTTIITFQNGVDNDHQIKRHVKNGAVYPGVAYIVSTRTEPGLIEHTGGPGKLIVGDRNDPDNRRLEEIVQLMVDSGIDAAASDDIARDLWKKYMFINAFSGMTAVCRSPIGEVLGDPQTRCLYERCVREAIAVAAAMDVNLAGDAFASIMTISANFAPGSKSSLLVDVENNRSNEIEALNGALVRLARKHQVDVPINALIHGAIKLA